MASGPNTNASAVTRSENNSSTNSTRPRQEEDNMARWPLSKYAHLIILHSTWQERSADANNMYIQINQVSRS